MALREQAAGRSRGLWRKAGGRGVREPPVFTDWNHVVSKAKTARILT